MTGTGILGGGASGLAAAIKLKRERPDLKVTVYEKLDMPGKKILATGNGRCNLSNEGVDISRYNGDSSLLYTVLKGFGAVECRDFFHSLGLLLSEEEGRIYPASFKSESVHGVLLNEAKRLGVEFRCGYTVETLEKRDGSFIINGRDREDYIIFSMGGKAAKHLGTDGDGYRILSSLGIRYNPISPALVQLKVKEKDITGEMKGARVRGSLSLLDTDHSFLGGETGEIQFTDYGISGIAAMQLSSEIAVMTKRKRPLIRIDFCPSLSDTALLTYLRDRQAGMHGEPSINLLTGLLQERVSETLLSVTDLKDKRAEELSLTDLSLLTETIKGLTLTLTGTKSFKEAQVTRGGVPANELREGSLESKAVPGLYFTGEILDVDGFCGGYNLHFAWGSGITAAEEILKSMEENR